MTKKTVAELHDEIDGCQKRDRESSTRVRELEASVGRQREDVDAAQRRVKVLRDEVAEKDGQLRVARMTLDTSEKQNQQQMCQVDLPLSLVSQVM